MLAILLAVNGGFSSGAVLVTGDVDISCDELDRLAKGLPGAVPLAECSEFMEALRSRGGVPAWEALLDPGPLEGLRDGVRG